MTTVRLVCIRCGENLWDSSAWVTGVRRQRSCVVYREVDWGYTDVIDVNDEETLEIDDYRDEVLTCVGCGYDYNGFDYENTDTHAAPTHGVTL